MLNGPPCADAVAFLKPVGIIATKRPSLPVTPADDDVVLDACFELADSELREAVVFVDVEVLVVADAATEFDDDEADPQPAKATAAVTASATAPYVIDDRNSAMLTGCSLEREGVDTPPTHESAAAG